MRLLVHTDQAYRRWDGALWTGQPFTRFLLALRDHGVTLTIAGRLAPGAGAWHVRLPADVGFVALPPRGPAEARALGPWWRALTRADVALLLGPNELSAPFAALARARRVPAVLGVRQELRAYVAHRRPGSAPARAAATALDAAFRALARTRPVIAVGPRLAAAYRHAPAVLDAPVSLVDARDVARDEQALSRSWDGPLRAVSAGRLDPEKNPLLLADVLAAAPERWTLEVCGDGPLRDALGDRARALGVAGRLAVPGHVAPGSLAASLRAAHALVHVSWTEGVPQVLYEAGAAGLPMVATDVGGVRATAGDAALLVPPGDARAIAAALERLASDPELRARLARAGLALARAHTLQDGARTVARFLARAAGMPQTEAAAASPSYSSP